MFLKCKIVCIAVLWISVSGYASETLLKLDDLIKEALEKNPIQEAAKQEMLSSKAQIGPKSSYEDPMIGFIAKDYPVDTLNAHEFGMTGNELRLTQKVSFPGKLSKIKQASTHEYEAKREMFHQRRLEIIRDVKKAFYGLFESVKKKDIWEEQKRLLRSLIVIAKNKYALGKISQTELLIFQIEEVKLLEQWVQIEREVQVQWAQLNTLLGRIDKEKFLSGRPQDIQKTSLDFSKLTFENILEKAIQQNPSLKALNSQFQSAAYMLSFAKWSYAPDFEFMSAYTFRKPSPGDRGVDFISAGVGMTIPIWAWSKQSEQVKSAKAEQAKAKALLTQEQTLLLQSLKSTYEELKENHQKVDLYETGLLPLTKQSVASGKAAYAAGRIGYLNLISLIQDRFRTEQTYYETLSAHELKISELEVIIGGSLDLSGLGMTKKGEKPYGK